MAGVTPSGPFQGLPEHVVMVVGYKQVNSNLTLIINDPLPYAALGVPDPYLAAGAVPTGYLQYAIDYYAFQQLLLWTDSLTRIQ
jgi:hypothetical protein